MVSNVMRGGALGCGLLLAIAASARGQRAALPISALDHQVWTIREGAPSSVQILAQSVDGMLWIGAASGLYRFDGVRFESVQPDSGTLSSLAINALLPLPDSSLWIGYSTGGVTRVERGRAVSYGRLDGLPEGTINAMVRDSLGTIWVATTTGVARFENGRWLLLGPDRGFPGGMTPDLLVDRRGTVWLLNRSGVFVLRRGTERVERQAPSLDPDGGGVGNAREAPDGSVWGGSTVLGLTRLSDTAGRPVPSRAYADRLRDAWAVFIDRRAMAWLLSPDGFSRVPLPIGADDGPQPVERIPLPDNGGASFLEDREGNIWLGTGSGLQRLREPKLIRVGEPAVGPSIVPAPSGGVWMAGFFRKASAIDAPPIRGVVPHDITCAHRDLSGGTWFAGDQGMWHAPAPTAAQPATFTEVMLPSAAGRGEVQAIARTLDGDLWVAIRGGRAKGVYRRRGAQWALAPLPAEVAGILAATVVADSAGGVWLGYPGGELIRVIDDSARVYSSKDGLEAGAVTALVVTGRRLWIGGESGLTLFDGGRFHSVATTPLLRGVTGIVETAEGDLWLNGSGGITHLAAGEVRRAVDTPGYQARGERFDHHDGLDGDAPQVRPLPSAVHSSDGRIWFTTHRSVLWIDPARIRRNTLPPPVQVLAVSVAGKAYPFRERIILPRRTTQLEVGYTALSLAMPDRVRFRYRLAGVDTAWVDAGTRREAFYTNLGPGEYRFQVIAANEDGVWNETGAGVTIDIPPTFTQTGAFTVLVVAAVLGAVWLLALWRHRQITRGLQAQFRATLAERTRLARELHDTLLGDLGGVALQLDAGARAAASEGAGTPLVELLSGLGAQVKGTIVAVRRSVNAIRATTDDLPPLHEQLAAAGDRVFAGTPVSLEVGHAGTPRPCPPAVSAEVLGIVSEAMLNARRHADCRTVTIECRYERREIQVSVRDDGRGFDPSQPPPTGHWGLLGMRERARSIGALLGLTSSRGAGTVVTLKLRDTRMR